MVLLGNVCQVKACFGLFRDCVRLHARWVHGLCRMYLGHGNHFGHTRSYSYETLVKRKLVSVRLEVVLISGQHRYTVCVECTRGMEIILGTADGTPRCHESCGSSCRSIWT